MMRKIKFRAAMVEPGVHEGFLHTVSSQATNGTVRTEDITENLTLKRSASSPASLTRMVKRFTKGILWMIPPIE